MSELPPHLSREEMVKILCMLVEAYNDMHETLNFLVEQILRDRMEGMLIDEKVDKTLKDFRIRHQQIDNNLSEFWHKAHEVLYPEKQDGY